MRKHVFTHLGNLSALALAIALALPAAHAEEWATWRGPRMNGISHEKGLVASWSLSGENLIWRNDFSGRSTPVIFDGRVCAIGRVGQDILRQEQVVCWDAETGKELWEKRYTVYNTFVPWNRLGWGSVAGDTETGYLFVNTSNGVVEALDRDGKTVWSYMMAEDFDRKSGYGGRTHTPIVDEDRVILAAINSGWGKQGLPKMRTWAFDKHSGEVRWISDAPGRTKDMNTQSTPVVAVVDGVRQLIGANSDGTVVGIQARTGKKLWSYPVSKVALNAGIVVADGAVVTSHSEENFASHVMGGAVAIELGSEGADGVAKARWNIEGLKSGYATPLAHDGRVYVLDNSANLHAIDLKSGEEIWLQNVGTVGKSGPVWADGKIYLTEVNGKFHILQDKGDHAEILDTEEIKMPDGIRHAEIYASPAVAYGRIYLVTEEGIYCIGDPSKTFRADPGPAVDWGEAAVAEDARPAQIHLVPAELAISVHETPSFHLRTYDADGHFLGEADATGWALEGLQGQLEGGKLELEPSPASNGIQAGHVVARLGDLEAKARVRAFDDLPWSEDFEGVEIGAFPASWLGRGKKATVQELGGSKVLRQPDPQSFAPRAVMYIGPSYLEGYTIQADIYAGVDRRRRPELGIINSGYTFLLAGIQQRLEIRSWGAELRMMQRQDFAWEMETWYTVKLRVDPGEIEGKEQAIVRGKVWKRGESEPGEWTMTAYDPLPIRAGAPGLYAFTRGVDGFFDNVQITESQR